MKFEGEVIVNIDPVLKLALSIHNNPGVYALLLGSGISRSAGIPTGWEILLELIRKLAAMEGENALPNEVTWYKNRFGKEPDYSDLLDALTSTPVERKTLLQPYFEPNEEEREKGLKMPTPAHHAIAEFVKMGYVRVILTTNFDRLLEKSLEEVGIIPDVIASDDALNGAMPYVHSRCYLVKLHGDYLDTRIKNTKEELENYSESINRLLDRILDEFGLIICGWSGEWDVALRNAILRSPNRRFPTYWLAKGELTEQAKIITQHRHAEVISIESADKFFESLLDSIKSLRQLNRPHPISTAVAVETVKRYIVEKSYRIKLHDLIREETEHVYNQISSERFNPNVMPTKETFQQRLKEYEAVSEKLLAMLAALGYYDTGDNAELITEAIERLYKIPFTSGYDAYIELHRYPALLFMYAVGICALASKNYRNLYAVLVAPKHYDIRNNITENVLEKLNTGYIFGANYTDKWLYPSDKRYYTPASNYLYDFLHSVIKNYISDDDKYDLYFDIFEYILSLAYFDIRLKSISDLDWAPVGRFIRRYVKRNLFEINEKECTPLEEFFLRGLKLGENWELICEGFFDGSIERFKEIFERHQKIMSTVRLR